MRTPTFLIGIVALASAAPAVNTAKNSSATIPSLVIPRINTQDSNWHIGCNKDHKEKCSYYMGAPATVQPRAGHDKSPIHSEYGTEPLNLPQYTPSPPTHTSPHPSVYTSPPYSGKPWKPSSPPDCNFVESECIDCNENPEQCDTCNFMFKCGEKKQCQYYGFRETMTMCHERGEECAWPWADDHSDGDDDEKDHEHAHDEKPEQPHGGKPEQPHGSKPEQPYLGEPKSPYGKPPTYPPLPATPEHPHGPKGGEFPPAHNSTQYPSSPYGLPNGKGKIA